MQALYDLSKKGIFVDKKSSGLLRQFKRITISFADFKEARDISQYILDNDLYSAFDEQYLLISALTNAMTIAYCKPFSGNDSRNKIKVPDLPKSIIKVLSSDEQLLHERLLQYRNQLIAHSDSQAIDLKFVIHDYGVMKMLQPIRNRSSKCYSLTELEMFNAISGKLLSHVATLRKDMEPGIIPLLSSEDLEDSIELIV